MSSPVYFPPLFVADTLRSAWPRGRAFHQEAAFSCHGSVWPRQGNGDPQSTTPTPRAGEATRPRFHVKPRESPVSPLPTEPTSRSNQRRIGS